MEYRYGTDTVPDPRSCPLFEADGSAGSPGAMCVEFFPIFVRPFRAVAITMSGDTAIIWFREDLRVHDNEALVSAVREFDRVLPVYVFDPREFDDGMFDLPKTGPHRTRFLTESVTDLRDSLRTRNGDLLVKRGEPESLLPSLAAEHDAEALFYHTTPASEEKAVEAAITDALDADGVETRSFWGKTLYHRTDLPTSIHGMDDTFTPWRKSVEQSGAPRDQVPTPDEIPVPEADPGEIPVSSDLGVEAREPDGRGVLPFAGGESQGRDRVGTYLWDEDCLREYKETRNGLLGSEFSSKLSAWLTHGCLSPRYVYDEVKRYESERVSNESTYWLVFELLWRDFMTFQFEKYGDAFFAPGGIQGGDPGWRKDREAFEQWANGETGVPFVDANMRELNETGYMSNRGRQNVASFLADWLEVDWRMGAAYFEAKLVDYDVCSNWGNWAYQAGVGNDSRDNYFNVVKQGKHYDSGGEYVRHWLPELADVGENIHEPWSIREKGQGTLGTPPGEGYPQPMIDMDAAHERLRSR
jgi:deoxyribodipyrimidine photo-lyase